MIPKPDPARAWKVVEDALRRGDIEQLDQATDEEVEQQMRAAGIDPGPIPSADDLISRAEERAGEREEDGVRRAEAAFVPSSSPRRTWVVWLAAAAVGAIAVTYAGRREIEALWHPEPKATTEPPEAPPPPTRQEIAKKLRDEAYDACAASLWALCGRKLDEAKAIDPAGESDLRVQGARREVDDVLRPDARGKR